MKIVEWVQDRVYKELFGFYRSQLLLSAKHSTFFDASLEPDEAIRDCMNIKALDALNQMESELALYFKRNGALSFSELPVVIKSIAVRIRGDFYILDIWEDNDNIDIMQ